ncbi:PREDICTED: putative F-box/FBD/LRR-repeat protein At5g52460 [Camelina sativa]|uniref:F-box/FBD/LRR-repeat protein At5g52460 n=1 Tax=Camelina sativa TaxID=90675 RepID=A0ABM0XFE9_CAMSA|nr:PREDICTED: putative F-box/FBD/LRR-repeat protein At5g52460 [Camelina sativa]
MVPKLEYRFNYSDDNIEGVCRFIDKSMELNKAPVLETFRFHLALRIHLDNRKVDASKWFENAVDRHVRVLELKLLNCTVLTKLPESIYTSKTLVELTVSNSIFVDVPSSAYLPSLKKLLLVLVRFKDEDSLVRLLSSCSVLARSTIRLIIVYNWKHTLSIKKLRLPFIRNVDFSGITFSRLERFKLITSSKGWSSLLLLVLNNSPKLRFLHIHSCCFDKSMELNKAPVLETLRILLSEKCPIAVDVGTWVSKAVDSLVRKLELAMRKNS